MKSISASIIVLAGAIVLVGGAFVRHGQTSSFLQLTGGTVGLVGLFAWYVTIKQPKD